MQVCIRECDAHNGHHLRGVVREQPEEERLVAVLQLHQVHVPLRWPRARVRERERERHGATQRASDQTNPPRRGGRMRHVHKLPRGARHACRHARAAHSDTHSATCGKAYRHTRARRYKSAACGNARRTRASHRYSAACGSAWRHMRERSAPHAGTLGATCGNAHRRTWRGSVRDRTLRRAAAACSASEVTAGGSSPRRPSASRSAAVNAAPRVSSGERRSSMPCGPAPTDRAMIAYTARNSEGFRRIRRRESLRSQHRDSGFLGHDVVHCGSSGS